MFRIKCICAIAACIAVCTAVAWGQTTPAPTGSILFVDDDGAQCPGALSTIQEAVTKATPGTTILVCPGTYTKQVSIVGEAKNAIRLIALGGDGEVVLEGDHTQPHGFFLNNVSNVLIRGFTVREFGNKPTTASGFGSGCGINLNDASYNVIENNRVTRTDMLGIYILNAAHNIVRHNLVFEVDAQGFGLGIILEGRGSTDNLVFQNYVLGQPGAGIMVSGAGPGNIILDNNFSNNGQWGMTHSNTEGTLIENNRFSFNAGAWGVITSQSDRRSTGIALTKSNNVSVVGNVVRNNTLFDLSWDKSGEIIFSGNVCETANQPELCPQK